MLRQASATPHPRAVLALSLSMSHFALITYEETHLQIYSPMCDRQHFPKTVTFVSPTPQAPLQCDGKGRKMWSGKGFDIQSTVIHFLNMDTSVSR